MRGEKISAFVDLGCSKVTCLITAHSHQQSADAQGVTSMTHRVIGLGQHRSQGIKAGVVSDMAAAEAAVRSAISQAERSANVELQEIYVSVACGRLKSQRFTARVPTETGKVASEHYMSLREAGRAFAERDGRSLVYLGSLNTLLDGVAIEGGGLGLAAHEIAAELHAVTADDMPLRNVATLIERCYLEVAGLVVSPFASGLAVTTVEERKLGVIVVDVGGGTATIAAFLNNQFVYGDAVPVGGNHLTFDIARTLQASLEEAERIKTVYGTLVGAPSDEHEFFMYRPASEEDGGEALQVSRGQLSAVLQPRMQAMLRLIGDRLEQAEGALPAARRIVFTGGASQLAGFSEFASNALQCPTRVGVPQALEGFRAGGTKPEFATVIGMTMAHVSGDGAVVDFREREALLQGAQGYAARFGQWLKEGF